MLPLALLSVAMLPPYAERIHVLNYMSEPMTFVGCSSSTPGIFQTKPKMQAVGHGFTDVFDLQARPLESMNGYCSWRLNSSAEAQCGHGNGTFPPGISSCPWIGWRRGGKANKTSISFTVEWDWEGPFEVASTSWSASSGGHKRYCFCPRGVKHLECRHQCDNPPFPPQPPKPDEPAVHYTDPRKTGCRTDELVMPVTNTSAICSPRCTHGFPFKKCPANLPTGMANMHASCNFIDDESNVDYCAVTCDKAGADCGAGATCHMNEYLGVGFCGYPTA